MNEISSVTAMSPEEQIKSRISALEKQATDKNRRFIQLNKRKEELRKMLPEACISESANLERMRDKEARSSSSRASSLPQLEDLGVSKDSIIDREY